MSEIVPASGGLDTFPPVQLEKKLAHKAQLILEAALAEGADACECGLSLSEGHHVTVRMGEVETVEFNRDRGLGVTVFFGQRKGSASSTDDSEESLVETVKAACAIARHTGEDGCNGLAAPEQLATVIPDLDLWHPWDLSPAQAIELAQQCEAAGRQVDTRITNSDGATISTGQGMRFYANSAGFAAGYPGSHHSVSCVLLASDGQGMQREYWYDASRVPENMMPVEQIGRRAAERALSRLGARRPHTGTVPVVFAPEVAKGLIGHFLSAIAGGTLYRNASFLKDCIGERLFPEWMQISEHPHARQMNSSAPFDSDGLPTREQTFVEAGRLKQYALDLYSARRLGLAPTGNGGGVRNVMLTPGQRGQAELLQDMGTGLLVTEVMGQGVNLVTGDYSRGAAGFWVENGEIQYPVEEFTLASTLPRMFAGIQAVGNDVDRRGNIQCGSVWLDQMKVAGV